MEISSANWLSESEMEYSANQYQIMNSNPHDYTVLDELNFPAAEWAAPVEEMKTADSWNNHGQIIAPFTCASSYSHIISFVNSSKSEKFDCGTVKCGAEIGDKDFSFMISQSSDENQNCYLNGKGGHEIKKGATIISTSCDHQHGREHVIAERKRREKLSQLFVALSALIPGLNKRDKASVLGGAIKYVNELKERVKWAEEEAAAAEKRRISCNFLISSADSEDDETASSDGRYLVRRRPVPKIETRVSDKDVLMEVDFCMTATDLGKKLRETLVEFI